MNNVTLIHNKCFYKLRTTGHKNEDDVIAIDVENWSRAK